MKNHFLLTLLLLAGFALFSTSCKKDRDPSRSEMIVGSWNVVAGGTDANSNTILDPEERENIPAGFEQIITFKEGGAGVATLKQTGTIISSQTQSFDWKFINEDRVLEIISGQGTLNVNVTLLTGQQFEGNNLSGTTRAFQIWSKL